MTRSLLEIGLAQFTLPGQAQSGDRCYLKQDEERAVIGVVDGVGHGPQAAEAAALACEVLADDGAAPLRELMVRCHERLRGSRGAAIALLAVDRQRQRLEWLGVGNVAVLLLHPAATGQLARTELFLRAGVVGDSLPATAASQMRIVPGDVIVAATDGVDTGFLDSIARLEPPQRLAERLLAEHRNGHDDALVLVARVQWGVS